MDFPKLRSLQELRLMVKKFAAVSELMIGERATIFRFKPMRSQWGSCNSAGIIAINTRLMYLPERLVGYVVHHEVLHLKIKNHGPLFRQGIEALFPDRLEINRILKTYSPIIRAK